MVQVAVLKAVGDVKMDVDGTPTDVQPMMSYHDRAEELIEALRPTNGLSPEGAPGSNTSKRQHKQPIIIAAKTKQNTSSGKG